jgi:hypothetical protein
MSTSKNPGVWIVILVVVILWNIYDMASTTETPSTAYSIFSWVLLICAGAGLIGAIVQFVQQKSGGGA